MCAAASVAFADELLACAAVSRRAAASADRCATRSLHELRLADEDKVALPGSARMTAGGSPPVGGLPASTFAHGRRGSVRLTWPSCRGTMPALLLRRASRCCGLGSVQRARR